MAKKIKEKKKKKAYRYELPFGKENFTIFLIGVFVTIIGYIFMAQGPADSFWSLTLAPILLVISYCILFPLSILYRRGSEQVQPVQSGDKENQN
jgi:membrane protein YdbS with pleckstrin-like domain